MAIFTPGKSKAINSPRYLTLRHARRRAVLHKVARGILAAESEEAAPPSLDPGQEKLNSYWAPGLEAGEEHEIVATQTVEATTDENSLRMASRQKFFVDAPQFSLPPGSVYSVYPPHGYPDDHRILPHVVLSDPHLPWERMGSPASEKGKPRDKRNKVPWLALFTFTTEELKLADNSLGGKSYKQTGTLAVNMTVKELRAIRNVASPITDDMGPHVNSARGDFIFMKSDLFKNLFSTFDDQNKRQDSGGPETTRYKYLSHVREINTAGMAVAGVEEIGIFSIVVGGRAGPLDNTEPVSVSLHLVSIEGVGSMGSFPTKEFVALCSLYSWNYTVMPPGMLNVHEAFDNIGKTLGVLRPPDSIIDTLKDGGKVEKRIAARLLDGYSMVRYRTQTGEQTVALYRGPFTPTAVEPTEEVGKACSNSGQDLQILDREVGIMDISYSSAWNLGRTLAVGNQPFAAALFRLRALIHTRTMKELKISVVRSTGSKVSHRSRTDVLHNLKETIKYLDGLHVGTPGHVSSPHFRIGPPQKRWLRPRLKKRQYPSLHYNARKIKDNYLEKAIEVALDLAKATDGTVYDETNTPVSTDWMIVLAFVLDRMFFSGVPAHYLISDATHVPAESLRFFHVDPNWVDAMIDGALSLANHSGEDRDRVAIKAAINQYLTHHPRHHPKHTPQIPRYGFYLRSDLVSMFPDLKVEITSDVPIDQAPLLRHEIVTDGVMMGLTDRQPGLPVFKSLVFTQPPHQQRFAVGWKLTKDEVDIDVRKQYTISQEDREKDPDRHAALRQIHLNPADPNNWFVWSTKAESGTDDVRLLRLPYYAQQQLSLLRAWSDEEVQKGHQKPFDDDTPNSALLAMQLTDPIYSLTVNLDGEPNMLAAMGPGAGDASSPKKPRTLTSMTPSRITPLVEADEDEAEGSDDSATATTTLGEPSTITGLTRHEEYLVEPHVSQANLGPHKRAIPLHTRATPLHIPSLSSSSARATKAEAGYSDTADAPQYNCTVYSQGNEENQIQTSGDNLPQDLIFSIHVEKNENSDYELTELDIRIPFGPADPKDHRLMASYDGPGPRMLSNPRFNVVAAIDQRGGIDCLLLRILPRSVNGYIVINKVQDLSFLLCLAKVNKFERDKDSSGDGEITVVVLETEATYRYYQGDQVKYDTFEAQLRNDDVVSG